MIRRLLSLLAARREAAELRVLLNCARADLGSLRRELAASQDERARLAAELLAARDALAVSQAEARDLNGRIRTLVGERDNALAEAHAAQIATRRAELAAADAKRAAKRGKP